MIFLSYARKDARWAAQMERDLRANGFGTWRDTRNLDPEQDFTGEIEAAIKAAHHVVVCLTPDVKRGDSFVRREIAYALAQDRGRREATPPRSLPLIPVVFPGGELPVSISTWTAIFVKRAPYLPSLLARLRRLHEHKEEASYTDSPELVDYLNCLHEWTSTRLQESVYTLITLAAADTPTAVQGTARKTLTFNFAVSPVLAVTPVAPAPSEPPEPLRCFSFAEAFQHHNERVLLLGAPGAGKTTTLLAFARDAAVARLNDATAPVPILANIHTWDQTTLLPDWAQSQVKDADLSGQRLLYLLDGLDELGSGSAEDPQKLQGENSDPRASFIEALEAQIPDDPVIVASRVRDYEEIGQRVALAGAVTLQPLTDPQIEEYLRQCSQTGLWSALQKDEGLIDIARTPLLLALLTIAFGHEEGEAPFDLNHLNEARIFDRYISRRFEHERAKPAPLPFEEEETRVIMGSLAATSWQRHGGWAGQVTVTPAEAMRVLGYTKVEAFAVFGIRMHFLQRAREDGAIQFIHRKLLDHCAVRGLLVDLRLKDWWGLGRAEAKVREGAAIALGLIGDAAAVPSLLRALRDKDKWVRDKAAFALGEIGVAAAVPGLLKALRKKDFLADTVVRISAACALGEIGDASAVPGLLKALRDKDKWVRENAAEALAKIGQPAVSGLLKALRDEGRRVRRSAAYALGQIGTPAGLVAVEEARRRGRV